jgi:hypothetical protein
MFVVALCCVRKGRRRAEVGRIVSAPIGWQFDGEQEKYDAGSHIYASRILIKYSRGNIIQTNRVCVSQLLLTSVKLENTLTKRKYKSL